jgi:hypothetical protein
VVKSSGEEAIFSADLREGFNFLKILKPPKENLSRDLSGFLQNEEIFLCP